MTNRVVFGKTLPLVCEAVDPPITEWVEERTPDVYYLVKGIKQTLRNCSLFAPTFVELGGEGLPAGQAPTPVAGNQIEFLEVPLKSVAEQTKIKLDSDETRQNLPLMKMVYEERLTGNDRRTDAAMDQIAVLADGDLSPTDLVSRREEIKQEISAIREDSRQTETALRELRKFL